MAQRRFPALLLLTALLAGAKAPPGFPALGDEVVDLVRDHFMDAGKAASWAERHAGYARDIGDQAAFRDETRRILAELETSHTQYYTPEDPGYHALLSIFEPVLKRDATTESLGMVTTNGFVAKVFAEGPAAQAGLLRGDRIVSETQERRTSSWRCRAGRTSLRGPSVSGPGSAAPGRSGSRTRSSDRG